MKLLFGLIFVGFLSIPFVISADPATAGLGVLASSAVLLGVLWTFRMQLPQVVQDAVLSTPPWRTLAPWTAFACIATLLVIGGEAHYNIDKAEQMMASIDAMDLHWAGWLAIAFCGPLFEEIVFRAWLIESLSKEFSRAVAVVVAALIFGLLHLDRHYALAVPMACIAGLVWGMAYLRSRSILPGLVAHILLNTAYLVSVNAG